MSPEVRGVGPFSTIRRTVERKTRHAFAVKIFPRRRSLDSANIQPEFDILRKIQHPNIVTLKGLFQDDQNYYIVMERVKNGNLRQLVSMEGPVSEDAGRNITQQLLSGLSYMDSIGISHRHIKPENVLIASVEPIVVKFCEFGFSKMSTCFDSSSLFLAPEVIHLHHSSISVFDSGKADIWSIGCLIYYSLTCTFPFNEPTQQKFNASVLSGKFPLLPLQQKEISDEAIIFLHSVLQVDPSARPSAKEALKLPWIAGPSEYDNASYYLSSQPSPSFTGTTISIGNPQGLPDFEAESTSKSVTKKRRHRTCGYFFQEIIYLYLSGATKFCQRGVERKQITSKVIEEFDESEEPKTDDEEEDEVNTIHAESYAKPHLSIVRDLERTSSAQLSEDTWMVFETLRSSIPRRDNYFTQSRIYFGNSTGFQVDVNIDDHRISKTHCLVYRETDKSGTGLSHVWLIDMSDEGICYVNETKVGRGLKARLQDGDHVYLFKEKQADDSFVYLGYEVRFVCPKAPKVSAKYKPPLPKYPTVILPPRTQSKTASSVKSKKRLAVIESKKK